MRVIKLFAYHNSLHNFYSDQHAMWQVLYQTSNSKTTSVDNCKCQGVVNFRDCALECKNTDHVLSEIIADANEEKCNSNVKSFCDPQFQSIGQVHIYYIYYHMSNNQLTKIKNDFFYQL